MKKRFLLLTLLCASIALGQFQAKTGNITVGGSTCTAATICVDMPIPQSNAATIIVTITGTWSGTLQFESTSNDPSATFTAISGSPQPTGVTVTSTNANGVWVFDTGGVSDFHVRASSLASGTAVITINPSPSNADATVNLQSGATVAVGPTSVAASGIVPAASTALETNHVFKATAGNMYSICATIGATSGYLMVFDASSAPGDGAVTAKLLLYIPSINATANTGCITYSPGPPGVFTTGITAVFSTTGPFTKTASNAAFSGSVQ